MTTRTELEATLAVQDAEALRLILDASGVDAKGAATGSELAARIVDVMWWSYSTPLGYVADRSSFEDIIWHVARKLRVDDRVDRDANAYVQSEQLAQALFGTLPEEAVSVDSLDADTQRRLGVSWLPTAAFGAGAGTSFATRWGSGKLLALLKTPVGRLLPLLPAVGPYIGALKTATSAAYTVAGPLGIGLSVLTFNQALGANYRRLVPLVLSVGALRPSPVDEAQVIDFPGTTRTQTAAAADEPVDDGPSQAHDDEADREAVGPIADAQDDADQVEAVEVGVLDADEVPGETASPEDPEFA